MTIAQIAIARLAKKLREDESTRPLTARELRFLIAVEVDIVRWDMIREQQDEVHEAHENRGARD
jgi:hypothetical protein